MNNAMNAGQNMTKTGPVRHLLSIRMIQQKAVCPHCAAPAGERCFTPQGLARLPHSKRISAAKVAYQKTLIWGNIA